MNMTNQPPLLTVLQAAGLTEDQAKNTQIELNKRMNSAIMEAVYMALTQEEQEKLEKALNQIDTSNVEAVTQALQNACDNSFNKVDADKIADEARFAVMDNFWQKFSPKLTQDQKNQVEVFFKKYLSENPNLVKVVNIYLKKS